MRFQVGFSWAQVRFMVFQGSRLVFKVPGWFFMVSGRFYGFSWFQVRFYVFSKVQGGFFMGPGGFLWLFKIPGRFLKVPGRFSWFFKVPGRTFKVFHDFRLVFMVPC